MQEKKKGGFWNWLKDFSKFKKGAFAGKNEKGEDLPIIPVLNVVNTVLIALALIALVILSIFFPQVLAAVIVFGVIGGAYKIIDVAKNKGKFSSKDNDIVQSLSRAECAATQAVLAPARVLAKGINKIRDLVKKIGSKKKTTEEIKEEPKEEIKEEIKEEVKEDVKEETKIDEEIKSMLDTEEYETKIDPLEKDEEVIKEAPKKSQSLFLEGEEISKETALQVVNDEEKAVIIKENTPKDVTVVENKKYEIAKYKNKEVEFSDEDLEKKIDLDFGDLIEDDNKNLKM